MIKEIAIELLLEYDKLTLEEIISLKTEWDSKNENSRMHERVEQLIDDITKIAMGRKETEK